MKDYVGLEREGASLQKQNPFSNVKFLSFFFLFFLFGKSPHFRLLLTD